MAMKPRLGRNHVRALAFVLVLLLISGLILGLFQSAGAVELRFEQAPASIQDTSVYVVDLKIDEGQRIPVRTIEAVVEEKLPSSPGKRGAILAAHAICPMAPMPGHACPRDAPFSQPNPVIPNLRFQSARSGSPDGPALSFEDMYGNGRITGTTTGFGYRDEIGYGGESGAPTPFDGGTGFGYGRDTSTLFLRYEITVNACRSGGLGPGTYYLTVIATTGLQLVAEDLSSPYTQFQVACPNGHMTSRDGVDVRRMTSVAPADGAVATYRHTIADATVGQAYEAQVPDLLLQRLRIDPARSLQTVSLELSRHAHSARPQNASFSGLQPLWDVFTLTIPGDHTAVRSATLVARVAADLVPEPERALLLRLRDGAWQLESNPTLVLIEGGSFEAELSDACCGLYAFGLDVQSPRVSIPSPGSTLSGNATFRADAQDSVGITQVSFYLNNQLRHVDDAAPYEFKLDTREYPDGQHRIRAVAYDFAGLSAEAAVEATFDN